MYLACQGLPTCLRTVEFERELMTDPLYYRCWNHDWWCYCLCVTGVVATDKYEVAFNDCNVAILVGAMPRRQGMERKDLLAANVKIFKGQGEALDKYAKKDCKVIGPIQLLTKLYTCDHFFQLKWEICLKKVDFCSQSGRFACGLKFYHSPSSKVQANQKRVLLRRL